MKGLIKAIASVFYLGYCPVMSGTVASAVFIFLIFNYFTNLKLYIFAMLFVVCLGFWVSGRAAEIFKKPDPREVVIDEVAGLFVALFLLPFQIKIYLIAFLIFRFLDILKPPPLSNVERIRGSAGIMLDDLLAGLFANILTQALLRFVL